MVELASLALDAVFHALSDGTRRAILRQVSQREMPVGEVAQPFGMSLAAVSKHLNVLERAHLIERVPRGTCRLVRLKATQLQAAQHWLAYYEAFWRDGLDRLQNQLEAPQEPSGTSRKET